MRASTVVILLLVVAFAGCLQGDGSNNDQAERQPPIDQPNVNDESETRGPTVAAEVMNHVAYRPSGQAVDPTSIDPDQPTFAQFDVGNIEAIEPVIELGLDGTGYYTGGEYLMESTDQGETWQDITPSLELIGTELTTGGDPVLERDSTGRLYLVLYSETCLNVFSGTPGAWDYARVCDIITTDHPTFFWAPTDEGTHQDVLVLCYNAGAATLCHRSLDGGIVWTRTTLPFPESSALSADPDPTTMYLGWECGILTGFGMGASDGSLSLPKAGCGRVEVAISRDSGLTWTNSVIAEEPGMWDQSFHEVKMAEDAAGNLYATYIDQDHRMKLAHSTDGGVTWSDPLVVMRPGITASKLPTVVAGGEGRVGWYYVGSDVEGGMDATDGGAREATWHAYFDYTLDGLSADPVIQSVQATPVDDPLRRGPCHGRCVPDPADCVSACGVSSASGGFYDYFDLDLSPTTGQIWMSAVDLCKATCATPNGTVEDSFAQQATVFVQVAGTKL